MAKVIGNILTKGLSGMVGNMLVFKQVGNETIVTIRPKARNGSSAKQQAEQSRFKKAVLYAKEAMLDSDLKSLYATGINRRCTSAHQVALTDFLNAPEVAQICITCTKSSAIVKVLATDNFMVKSVSISIVSADGEILNTGNATQQPGSDWWLYTLELQTSANSYVAEVTAADWAGNCSTASQNFDSPQEL